VGRKKLVRQVEPPSKRGIAWPRWTGFRGMTLRSWLELLVVPLMLVALGFWFTTQQDARQQKIENQRAEAERELANQRAQDEALQAYLDQMSSLLLEKDLRDSKKDSEVRTLARARTLTVLGRLDADRKTQVMQFLVEAELVQGVDDRDPIVALSGAELSGADLEGADLSGAYLIDANLDSAYLSDAYLSDAYLTGANLSSADLRNAYLSYAGLYTANLGHADLSYADLRDADLSHVAGWTEKQLSAATSPLEGTTMPDGQTLRDPGEDPSFVDKPTFEDWLKDQEGRKEDGKNE
jgi:uncharacterized protein YjbI with pentapeptide repeats